MTTHRFQPTRYYRTIGSHEPALHINVGELTARAHERGFDDLNEVHTAVLYPNGTIYMKAAPPTDSQRLEHIQHQLQLLHEKIAASR